MNNLEEFTLVSPTPNDIVLINTAFITSVLPNSEGGTDIHTGGVVYYINEDYIEVLERLQ